VKLDGLSGIMKRKATDILRVEEGSLGNASDKKGD
jgi:hypothetical protein